MQKQDFSFCEKLLPQQGYSAIVPDIAGVVVSWPRRARTASKNVRAGDCTANFSARARRQRTPLAPVDSARRSPSIGPHRGFQHNQQRSTAAPAHTNILATVMQYYREGRETHLKRQLRFTPKVLGG